MNAADESMFGCDLDKFIESVERSITFKFNGVGMVIAGLMSDAQEELQYGNPEAARKTLNKAKALLFRAMEGRYELSKAPEGWAVANT